MCRNPCWPSSIPFSTYALYLRLFSHMRVWLRQFAPRIRCVWWSVKNVLRAWKSSPQVHLLEELPLQGPGQKQTAGASPQGPQTQTRLKLKNVSQFSTIWSRVVWMRDFLSWVKESGFLHLHQCQIQTLFKRFYGELLVGSFFSNDKLYCK